MKFIYDNTEFIDCGFVIKTEMGYCYVDSEYDGCHYPFYDNISGATLFDSTEECLKMIDLQNMKKNYSDIEIVYVKKTIILKERMKVK